MRKSIWAAQTPKSKKMPAKPLEKSEICHEEEIRRMSWMILMHRKRRARFN
ncbi:MAG: hypothetical protein ACE5IR_18035 [bacterium]